MNFKKRVNGSWVDTPNYIHKTDTDTFTTLPAVLYPTGSTATVGLKGQTTQSSIPSPTSPVMPQSCGERTGNLVTNTNFTTTNLYINVATLKSAVDNDSLFVLSLETNIAFAGNSLYLHTDSGNRIVTTLNGTGHVSTTFKLTETDVNNIKSSNSPYFYIYKSGADFSSTSVELHSGYKIPILSANTTTNVYLGEVETTRQIKKLVLTGEETISGDIGYNRFFFTIQDMRSEGLRLTKLFCTHYQNISDGRPIADVPNNAIYTGGADSQKVFIKTTAYTTLADFNAYLAAQYAAGTPVTVWYVLAEPTTGIVNEPLRKIGNYADEVSGITIPTIAGANTISVDTTLQPSEVTVNYKGWHPVADVHEYDNGAWD